MTTITPVWMLAQPNADMYDEPLPTRADTVVVGGGLTGLSAAYHILKAFPGRQVVVLEADRIGAGASGRNTGMLTPGVGQNFASLVRRLGDDAARRLYETTLDAVRYVAALVAEERIECDLRMTGQLIVAHGRGGPARLAKQAQLFDRLGLPHESLDAGELKRTLRLFSASAARGCQKLPHGLRLPVAGTLNPGRLLFGLARRIRELGGQVYEQSPVAAIGKDKPVSLRLATGAAIVADNVVLATSGYTPNLGIFRGRVLPVHLQVLLTDPLEPAAMSRIGWKGRECVTDSRRIFNFFRLTSSNEVVFGGGVPRYLWGGSTEDTAFTSQDERRLRDELKQTFGPDLGLRIAGHWRGVIGYVLDTLPVVHRLRDYPGVLYAGGWCGHGLALGVYSGVWLAHMLAGKQVAELPCFRDRPPALPFELARWAGFRAATCFMSFRDRRPLIPSRKPNLIAKIREPGGRKTAGKMPSCAARERPQ